MQILNNNGAWRNKKHNVALGLLDIALFLIVAGRLNLEYVLFQDDNFLLEVAMDAVTINGPVTGLINNPRYLEGYHGGIYNSKLGFPQLDNLLLDYETQRNINFQTENDTYNQFTDLEVNTVMVVQMPPDAQPPIQTLQAIETENRTNINEHLHFPTFDVFDATLNVERDDLVEEFTNEIDLPNGQHFDNTEEVRWQDFVVNYTETSYTESIIIHNNNIGFNGSQQDVGFSNDSQSTSSDDNARHRTTSVFSDESGIEIEEYYPTSNSAASNHSLYTKQADNNVNSSKSAAMTNSEKQSSIASTSKYSIRKNITTPSALEEMEQKDMNMMQSMYQQDIDLGFEWQPVFEPRQPVKEVDETKPEKIDNQLDLGEFFVDGETGEQIPINSNQKKNLINNTQHINQNLTDPQTQIDLDEYLDMLETSIDTIQPVKNINQNETLVQARDDMVVNLSSLIEPLDNSTANNNHAVENIWEEIENLSELTGLNLQGNQTQNSSNIVLSNVRLSNATAYGPIPPPPQQQQEEERRNLFNQTNLNYNNKYETIVQTEVDDQVHSPPGYFMPNYPIPPYNINAEDGIPMEEDLSPGLGQQENGYLLNNQLNKFREQPVEMEESPLFGANVMNPHLAMLPEPGQGFFEPSSNEYSNMMPDMLNGNVPSNTFGDNNNNSPFLNPSQMPYVPPPLVNNNEVSPLLNTFLGKNAISTVDSRAISESYEESDSGVSMEHSPQGFNMFDDSVQPLLDDRFCLTDITAINHNHTYDGTPNATKPKSNKRKKLDDSTRHRESRDEKKARELNVPFTLDEIILSPVEDYNEMLARTPLTPEQHNLIKDIRRRGKNKVAAQNCRKRKIETITGMEDDVDLLRQRKQQLVEEQQDLDDAKDNMKLRYNSLYQQIFSSLRDDAGLPYDPSRFSLEQVEGAILLVQRVGNNSRHQINDHDNQQPMDQDDNRVDFSKVKIEKQK